ncbi:MAG: hypothetical protein JNL58_23865 [Planctomyces sp.]|nr:hypothetical protein [Planctomyces sp.]
MKAKRTSPGQMVNPNYSASARQAAREASQPYDVKQFLNLHVGEIVDDPDCWRLCLPPNACMAPADDECADKVLQAMKSEKRVMFLRNLARMDQAEIRKQMSKGELEWLDEMLKYYSDEVAELQSKSPASKPASKPAPKAD